VAIFRLTVTLTVLESPLPLDKVNELNKRHSVHELMKNKEMQAALGGLRVRLRLQRISNSFHWLSALHHLPLHFLRTRFSRLASCLLRILDPLLLSLPNASERRVVIMGCHV